ncbi:DNA polymerase III subunit gamma/tau [Flavobacterium sp.]|uniref:DNA polymerase III subunit gamma/tau n=1 Tax=Flavobacterium sp. TaxID=239 RepID=UPI003526C626
MLNANCLYHFRWRKKKAKSYIIPATHYQNTSYSIIEEKPKVATEIKTEEQLEEKPTQETTEKQAKTAISLPEGKKVSAFSIKSIQVKKELEAQQQKNHFHAKSLPNQDFTETDMLLVWNKYAQRLTDQGKMLMATYMKMNDPVLNGTTIELCLPNNSTKEEFLSGVNELLGYLRGKLHNHDIAIEVIVNESTEKKYAFTPIEKYERLKEINPNIELLKKLFDLDI